MKVSVAIHMRASTNKSALMVVYAHYMVGNGALPEVQCAVDEIDHSCLIYFESYITMIGHM